MRVGLALVALVLLLAGCTDEPKEEVPEPTVEYPPLDGILPVVSGNYTVPDGLTSQASLITATPATPVTPEDNLIFRSTGYSLFRFQAYEEFQITNWTEQGDWGKLALIVYAEDATLPTAECGAIDAAKFRFWYKAAGYETKPVSNGTLPAGVYRAIVAAQGTVEVGLKLGSGANSVEVTPVDLEYEPTYAEPSAWNDKVPPITGKEFSLELPIERPSFVFTAVIGSPFVGAGQASIHSALSGAGESPCAEDGRSSDMSAWAPYNQYGTRVAATWLSAYVFAPGTYLWSADYTWTVATPIGGNNAEAYVVPFPPA